MAGEPIKNKISPKTFKRGIYALIYALLILLTVLWLYVYLKGFFVPPKVLLRSVSNSSVINSLIINSSNTYLALLQELVISASMIFGFYAVLLFYFVDHITKFADTYNILDTIFIKWSTFIFTLLPFLLIFFSIFFSLNATIIYGTLNTHEINITVSNNTNSYSTLKANVYNSIYMLFFGAGIIISNLIIFVLGRLWLFALPKKHHGDTILLFIWLILILFVLFSI